jgi:5-methyltetrahydrofolate--homocysteine methyltransferase
MIMADLEAISKNLIEGNEEEVRRLTQEALDEGIEPKKILEEGLIKGMDIVGEKFANNEYYIPEVLLSADAMYAGMELLRPILTASGVKPIAKVAIGTVKGDVHDIGKNLVAMMLEGAGFEIINLGKDVDPQDFVTAVKEQGAQIVAMSTLMTTTMPQMQKTIEALKNAGLTDTIIAVIGGAPVFEEFADQIGAQAYAKNAMEAAEKLKAMVSKK